MFDMSLPAAQFNRTVFLLANPAQWALRYRDRPQVDCALFVRFQGKGEARKATLLDIFGQEDYVFDAPALQEPSDDLYLNVPHQIVDALKSPRTVNAQSAPGLVLGIAKVMTSTSERWEEFSALINQDRYEASVWFERDRKNLCLTDLFINREVVELWDEDVSSAIESGYLRPPRFASPSSKDWLNPLLNYARSQGGLSEPFGFDRPVKSDAAHDRPPRMRE